MNGICTYETNMERVGKIVAGSKLKYTWVFTLSGDNYTVHLYHSKVSSKYEIRINGKQYMMERGKTPEQFKYDIRLSNHDIKIMKPNGAETFHLFIDRKDFNALKSPDITQVSNSNGSPMKSGDTTKDEGYNGKQAQHRNIDIVKELANNTNRKMSVDHTQNNQPMKTMLKHPRTTDYGNINYDAHNKINVPVNTLGGLKLSDMETSDIFFNDKTVLDVHQDCTSFIVKKVNAYESG